MTDINPHDVSRAPPPAPLPAAVLPGSSAPAAPAPATGISDLLAAPTSPGEALARIESLKSDTAFGKLLTTKIEYGQTATPEVAAAKALWDKLHKLAFPTPQASSPEQIKDMPAHHDIRRQAEMNSQHGMRMRADGYTDLQIHQILGGRPIPADERGYHEQRFQVLKNDREFMARWSKGDRDAILEMKKHASARKLPVGTVAECEAWDRAHPFRR
jgi:hypothetical protein